MPKEIGTEVSSYLRYWVHLRKLFDGRSFTLNKIFLNLIFKDLNTILLEWLSLHHCIQDFEEQKL